MHSKLDQIILLLSYAARSDTKIASMVYERIIRPLLFVLDPEFVHRQTIRTGARLARSPVARRRLRSSFDVQFPELQIEAFGIRFKNPIGLAAGFDKQGYIYPLISDVGFGHMEIGSVSLLPWRGNPSPTLLRLPKDGGLINRPGLNSEGSEVIYHRLRGARFEIPTALNLVKTADPAIAGEEAIEDYLQNFARFYALADFITLNLSCPNTVEGRTFEDPSMLAPFLRKLKEDRVTLAREHGEKPVLVKISPDLIDAELDRVMVLASDHGINGIVIGNTTSRREGLKTPANLLSDFGFGGLSGRPLKRYIQEMVRKVSRRSEGRLAIVACGGVGCDPARHPAEEVWEYLQLGAALVQLHTGLIYRGPSVARTINEGLLNILRREGLPNLGEFFAGRSEAVKKCTTGS